MFGHKSDFEMIGGWNDKDFPGLYWEDNELCYRAERAGLLLKQVIIPLVHLSNYTSRRTDGAYDYSQANREVFERIVRQDKNNG
jgi:GT2 family glycosyltransferase